MCPRRKWENETLSPGAKRILLKTLFQPPSRITGRRPALMHNVLWGRIISHSNEGRVVYFSTPPKTNLSSCIPNQHVTEKAVV